MGAPCIYDISRLRVNSNLIQICGTLDEDLSTFVLFTAVGNVLWCEKGAKFCVYTAIVVRRTQHDVTLYVHCVVIFVLSDIYRR